jgi:peptidoglycan/xylan/chitin deacetylase (PgdA/CDA1 family)
LKVAELGLQVMYQFSKTLCAATIGLGLAAALSNVAQAACDPAKTLGVARTITIDATGGKLYGGLQYKTEDLLKDNEVILTFDDGPLRRHTRKVLSALKSHCTKASFFMVGRMAVSDPAMVREVESDGHTIAHHTWSHKNLHSYRPRTAGGEIELGISAIRIAAGKPISPFFRFPYLADSSSMIAYGKSRNLAMFSIDIDSYDYKTRSSDKVHANIMRQLRARKKGIMLFHDIQPSTANAMQGLLDNMQREGYKIVHIVAKAPVATLTSFDEQAQSLHDKKRTIATANAAPAGDYENARGSIARPSTKAAQASTPTKVASDNPVLRPAQPINPFSNGQPAPPQATQPAKDWRRAIWGN